MTNDRPLGQETAAEGDIGTGAREAAPAPDRRSGLPWLAIMTVAWLACLAVLLLAPIRDTDFFWHLATGDWIAAHHALPTADPFTYTAPSPPGDWQRFILRAYWLSQLADHAAYSLAGFPGIAGLRALVVLGLVGVLLARAGSLNPTSVGFAGAGVASLLPLFPFERPVAFSFLGFALTLWLVDRIRHDERPGQARLAALVGVPLTFGVWANCHPGFLSGLALLALAVAVEGFLALRRRSRRAEGRWLLLSGSAALGALASLANPSGWQGARLMRTLDSFKDVDVEYLPAHVFLIELRGWILLLPFALLAASLLLLLWLRRRADLLEALLLVALAALGLRHVRYVPFFVIAAAPFLARHLVTSHQFRRMLGVVPGALLLVGAGIAWSQRSNVESARAGRWIDDRVFPVAATDFLADKAMLGNFYNSFDWGGYLAWRLGPSRRVFVDGRCMNPAVCSDTVPIDRADRFPDGTPVWKRAFDAWGVGTVMIAWFWPDGRGIPLAQEMAADPGWVQIWSDRTAVILIRRLGRARPLQPRP